LKIYQTFQSIYKAQQQDPYRSALPEIKKMK